MTTLKVKILSNLKKIIKSLEQKWSNTNSHIASPIYSLAPKILTEEKELDAVKPYIDTLKSAIEADGINNIAITGSFGSGKSTILKTFQSLHPEFKYLNISLASFKENKEKTEDSEFERILEVSILQQMFYHVEPSKIPDSRFKRIVNLKPKKKFFITLFFLIWILCSLTLFKFNYIEKWNPVGWDIGYSIDWITFLYSIIFIVGLGIIISKGYRLFSNSKINKINLKGELELGDTIDKSIFNQHLEEILYFFERTDFNVVIIEDVDRFESTDIFTKLREINILINNSNLIKRPVKFIYAIKDEMFKDKNDRVKFFELIIPIIPFINPSNASEQLTKLISNAKLEGILSPDFTSDVLTFIDDIEMRLLINIFHEYQIYKTILSDDLNQDNLFAIIVYKNLYPDDFGELQKRKGNLYKFFDQKPNYINNITSKIDIRLKEIDDQSVLLKEEFDKSIKELRAIYIFQIISKLNNFKYFYLNRQISLLESLDDSNFKEIMSTTNLQFFDHSIGIRNSGIKFIDVEKEISKSLTYLQREKLLNDKTNNQINILRSEKEELSKKINEIELMTIKEIFEQYREDDDLGSFKENNLMRNLLLNGYIDENYDDYISLFHEVNLTKEDFLFVRKVKSGQSLSFDYELIKIDNLLKNLPDRYCRKEEALNYNLLNFLLENEQKVKTKFKNFFDLLNIDGNKQFAFIHGFIKTQPPKIKFFIQNLCEYKPTLWQFLSEKSKLSDDEIRSMLNQIFSHGDKSSIIKFKSLETLDSYISKMDNFFSFCSSLNQTYTIKSYIVERQLKFNSLDLPKNTQEKLFDAIYTNNLYLLNQDNILSIITGSKTNMDEEKLNVAHYTTLLESGLEKLLSYINDNIETYIDQVLLFIPENKEEDEKTIVDILNRDDVNLDLKTRLITSQNTKISLLENVNELELKQIILKNNKLTVNWDNVFDYFNATDLEKFDDILIPFLNKPVNYKILSKDKIRIEDDENDFIKKVSGILLQSNSLELDAYANLMSSLPDSYNSIKLEILNDEKIKVLISKKILNLTTENFNELKLKGNNLHIKLIECNQNKFIETMDQFTMEPNDWLLVFESSVVTLPNKLEIIKKSDDSVIIENVQIADVVCSILPIDKEILLSYDVLLAMFKSNRLVQKRIELLNLYILDLNNVQVQELIEELGEDYKRIFIKQNKPVFPNKQFNIQLFEHLKHRNMISSFSVVDKAIKVIAKYND